MRKAQQRLRYLAGRGWLWATHGGLPVGLPARGTGPSDRTRRRAGRREVLRRWPWPLRPLAWLAMFPGWAWGAWAAAGRLVRDSPDLAAAPGRARIWRTALRHSFSPREVVEYGLTDPGAEPGPWFCEHEMLGIWERLSTPDARTFAANKLAFARFCTENALPHARTLAVWNNGAGDANPEVWHQGVVLKPMTGNNAAGFEAWARECDVYTDGTARLSPSELAARGSMLSLDWGVMLAQPLLQLHPALAATGLHGMPVARLITGRWPDGKVALLDAYFSAPLPGAVASNAGFGPKWPVDIAEGRIGQSLSRVLPRMDCPGLVGSALPGWAEASGAVCRGHAAFPHKAAVLGWDAAFTASGVVLLEANTGISLIVPQGTRRRPVGRDPIAALVEAWLRTEG